MAIKNPNRILFLILFLLVLGLSGCERSASTPPPPTQAGGYPVPEGTQAPMAVLEQFSTQTAIAAAGGVVAPAAAESSANVASAENQSQPAGEQSAPAEEPKPTATAEPQPQVVEEPEPEPQPQPEPQVKAEYNIPETYTLTNGEFPYCIARRFNIAPAALLSANGLSSSSVTYPGTVLKIPKDAAKFNQGSRSLRQHPTTYTVRAGDTVNSIACLFGDVDPRAIEDANGFSGSYTMNVGSTIQIP